MTRATTMNSKAVNEHYGRSDLLYLKIHPPKILALLSTKPSSLHVERIEQASHNKLEVIFKALDLKPGMTVLDLGGGWGGVTQYCGARGVHVTTLTLTTDSARFT
ncbi:uncharacterized protein N7477_009295 [Penicillium maclennaniae]|uniref:uncharacterized protein n=1 Tax=Penicillium maclennaniae TaxID=1343394 RepID=UPI0025409D73|nr:uncharacterized protein N7477_009295 [Penicillium maclennaniae]KAJ5661679.1 hypothetical protein N7477_009295 [Penicillium maclennaniae]